MPAVANDLAQTTVGIIFIRGNVLRRDLRWGAIRERSVRDFAVIAQHGRSHRSPDSFHRLAFAHLTPLSLPWPL